jgi:hypothetical protein
MWQYDPEKKIFPETSLMPCGPLATCKKRDGNASEIGFSTARLCLAKKI